MVGHANIEHRTSNTKDEPDLEIADYLADNSNATVSAAMAASRTL
jgi:hypothetical protein